MFDSARLGACAALLACLVALCPLAAGASPAPDPSAFMPVPTNGVVMSPLGFLSGQRDYALTLSSDAFILYGGTQYPITQIWAFFAVNATGVEDNDVTATGDDAGDWSWDQKPTHGTVLGVGGWLNASKSQAMETPLSGNVVRAFHYGSFAYSQAAPVIGLHVTVAVPAGEPSPFGSGNTGMIIPTAVPEPASLTTILCGFGGLVGFALRRHR